MTDDGPDESDELLKAVGERIKTLRQTIYPTQDAFAAATGMSQRYISRLESGRQNLNLRSISRIALTFGIPMSELLEGIDADPATLNIRPYRQ